MKKLQTILDQIDKQANLANLIGYEDIMPQKNWHGGQVMFRMSGTFIAAIWASDMGWDHVSVSCRKRTPKYQEMKTMKRFFLEPDEWAMELHPPVDDYISVNDNVLHIWRPHDLIIPTPPKILV